MRILVALLAASSLFAQAVPVSRLEAQLRQHPGDIQARSALIRQYFLESTRDPAAEQARVGHVLWLVEHRPESDILGEPSSTLENTSRNFMLVKNAWLAQVAKPGVTGAVLANAANYFRPSEPSRSIELLIRARSVEPANPNWTAALGQMYAFQLSGIKGLNQNGFPVEFDVKHAMSAEVQSMRAGLLASNDAELIGAVASGLAGQGLIAGAMTGRRDEIFSLTEQFIERAETLEPRNAAWHAMLGHLYTQRVEIANGAQRAGYARKAFNEFERARALDSSSVPDGAEYGNMAVEAGELAQAQAYGEYCLAQVPKLQDKDDSVHACNVILGRVALRRGDLKRADAYLLAASQVRGGGALSSFGPNMMLAYELLEKGERQTVLDYLRRCATFWTSDRGQLARWSAQIRAGRIPQFGANLSY